MVLESLISLRDAIKNPSWVFVIGGLVSVICLTISFLVFPETSTGLFMIFLITFALTPLMVNLMKYEEAKEEQLIKIDEEANLFHRYKDILKVYTALFSGMILSLSIVFIMLPETMVQKAFSDQINEINKIRGKVVFTDTMSGIIINNIGVLFLAFLFSFIFGAGAVFILAWNASILAVAIGSVAKTIGGIKALPMAILPFFPHGSLEILAYFVGGIAGGLVSMAITRRKSGQFMLIFKDSLRLMSVSIVLLLIAGVLEAVVIKF